MKFDGVLFRNQFSLSFLIASLGGGAVAFAGEPLKGYFEVTPTNYVVADGVSVATFKPHVISKPAHACVNRVRSERNDLLSGLNIDSTSAPAACRKIVDRWGYWKYGSPLTPITMSSKVLGLASVFMLDSSKNPDKNEMYYDDPSESDPLPVASGDAPSAKSYRDEKGFAEASVIFGLPLGKGTFSGQTCGGVPVVPNAQIDTSIEDTVNPVYFVYEIEAAGNKLGNLADLQAIGFKMGLKIINWTQAEFDISIPQQVSQALSLPATLSFPVTYQLPTLSEGDLSALPSQQITFNFSCAASASNQLDCSVAQAVISALGLSRTFPAQLTGVSMTTTILGIKATPTGHQVQVGPVSLSYNNQPTPSLVLNSCTFTSSPQPGASIATFSF